MRSGDTSAAPAHSPNMSNLPKPIGHLSLSDRIRFLSKVDTSGGPDACHLWTAAVQRDNPKHKGRTIPFGKFTVRKGVIRLAHRVAWKIATGEERLDAVIAHTCGEPRCVNVRHLFPANQAAAIAAARKANGTASY